MDIKKLIKKIAAIVGSLVLVVGIIVGDVVCYSHESEITSHLCPDKVVYDTTNSTEALAESDKVIQRVAEEGITLLKNNGTLPLDYENNLDDEDKYAVNLFGVGSTDSEVNGFYLFGQGSGTVTLVKEKAVFLKNALENTGFSVNENLYEYFKTKQENPTVDWWGSEASKRYLDYAKYYSDTAIVTVSRFTGENRGDRQNLADVGGEQKGNGKPWATSYVDNDKDGRNFCQLSLKEEAMIKYCAENFENVIVIINSGNVMELGLLEELDGVDAVMYVPYTGQTGANAIGKILKGEINPSGKTTDTFAYSTSENAPYYADAMYNSANGAKQIAYTEDIYIGYKWYETADKEGFFTAKGTSYDKVVQYPFGYGLTYTSFEWTVKSVTTKVGDGKAVTLKQGDTITDKNTTVTVAVEVKNTGSVAGKEVVQLYTTAPYTKGGIEKPYVALTDFEKTQTLYPASEADGKEKLNSQILTLSFDLYDIASYDCYDKNNNGFAGRELERGDYTLSLRNNAHEVNACENANFTFKIGASGLRYETDPVTGYKVENRFTGETAEAGVPTDGSNDTDEKITYLSRADFAGTYPTTKFTMRTKGLDVTNKGIGAYLDDEKVYGDLEMPTLNAERKLFLYTLEDGTPATYDDLSGKGKTVTMNEELVLELGKDYNSPKWDDLLKQLTVSDIKKLVTRCSLSNFAAPSIGKTSNRIHDGPAGINNSTLSFEQLEGVSAFPCEALAGMTWNKDLLREMGAAMGTETAKVAIAGLYAPAIDVHRHPYNSRNYEQFGEDPVLVGKLGAKEVYGMTTHGIQVSIKHFVISTPGMNARRYNSWITEQNLRENYLKPFEESVKKAEANYLMTSYSNVGGVMCATSYALNTEILRNEWGFVGSVITDYDVPTDDGRTTANLIRAGNDLRFLGNSKNESELDENNAVDMALAVRSVKNSVYSMCNTYYRTKNYDPKFSVTTFTTIPAFNWWIPSLVALNVLIFAAVGIMIFFNFLSKKGRSETVELVSAVFGKKPAQTAAASATVAATEATAAKPIEQVAVEPKAEEATKAKEGKEIPLTPMSAPQKPLDTSSKDFASEIDKNYFNGVKYQTLSVIQGSAATEENGEVTIAVNGDKKLQIAVEDGRTAVYFYQGSCAIAKIKIVSLKTYRAAMLLIG